MVALLNISCMKLEGSFEFERVAYCVRIVLKSFLFVV